MKKSRVETICHLHQLFQEEEVECSTLNSEELTSQVRSEIIAYIESQEEVTAQQLFAYIEQLLLSFQSPSKKFLCKFYLDSATYEQLPKEVRADVHFDEKLLVGTFVVGGRTNHAKD